MSIDGRNSVINDLMREQASKRYVGPAIRLVIVAALAIFAVETAIMLLAPDLIFSTWGGALFHASLITFAMVAVLYFYMFRPMTQEIDRRSLAEKEIILAHAELVRTVGERTSELKAANEALRGEVHSHAAAEAAVVRGNEQLRKKIGELELQNYQINILAELSDDLQASRNSDEAHRVIARQMKRLFPDASGALRVIDASRSSLEIAVAWGGFESSESSFTPNDCWALRRGVTNLVEDKTDSEICAHFGPSEPYQGLCVPILAQGEALGVLILRGIPNEAGAEGLSATESRRRLAESAAEAIGLALANLNLRELLRQESVRDPLTGLLNRRYMEEALEREISRAARNKTQLGVVMLDIDNFKDYNDAEGHDGADALLRELSAYLSQQVRGGDVVCRFGGEEFVFILPETNAPVVIDRMEQIRDAVKLFVITHRNRRLGNITVSSGIAVFPFDGSTRDDLLHAADTAMYAAKRAGRDAVRVFGDIKAA